MVGILRAIVGCVRAPSTGCAVVGISRVSLRLASPRYSRWGMGCCGL